MSQPESPAPSFSESRKVDPKLRCFSLQPTFLPHHCLTPTIHFQGNRVRRLQVDLEMLRFWAGESQSVDKAVDRLSISRVTRPVEGRRTCLLLCVSGTPFKHMPSCTFHMMASWQASVWACQSFSYLWSSEVSKTAGWLNDAGRWSEESCSGCVSMLIPFNSLSQLHTRNGLR